MSNLDIIPPNKSYTHFSYQIGMSLHEMKADKQSTIAHSTKMVIPSDFHTWVIIDNLFSLHLEGTILCFPPLPYERLMHCHLCLFVAKVDLILSNGIFHLDLNRSNLSILELPHVVNLPQPLPVLYGLGLQLKEAWWFLLRASCFRVFSLLTGLGVPPSRLASSETPSTASPVSSLTPFGRPSTCAVG